MPGPTSPDAETGPADATAERVPPQAVLPPLRALASHIIDTAVAKVEARGEQVSCRAGCAACCRQLVAISDIEAHAIVDLIERLPAARRADIEARFADAERRIASWRPLDAVIDADADTPIAEQAREAHAYFHLGIDCPFLEDERCSIYADRPLMCREYLVTSPASHCASPDTLRTQSVPLGRPSRALARLTSDETPPRPTYVPLPLTLYWHRHRSHALEPRPLAEWAARFEAASRAVVEKMESAPADSVLGHARRVLDQD
ncbi:YkgJ family cysteine cluster protein [Reyranella sp. CPCC 100927]|uniref:YkgJ family cysteine cluster protein n=1 Tax=Reyranella sp. CPCC 100927 TaxID=2599616 RepID=UPI0011B805C7|nr:YkgJ family cysteine cluster protein [Reyranella sp. CPCC 100927]TWT03781.1 YkgJ family cysteine cluster protein [Reyranella sp. CPCC 100927]